MCLCGMASVTGTVCSTPSAPCGTACSTIFMIAAQTWAWGPIWPVLGGRGAAWAAAWAWKLSLMQCSQALGERLSIHATRRTRRRQRTCQEAAGIRRSMGRALEHVLCEKVLVRPLKVVQAAPDAAHVSSQQSSTTRAQRALLPVLCHRTPDTVQHVTAATTITALTRWVLGGCLMLQGTRM